MTDLSIRALKRRVASDPSDLETLKRLVAVLERSGRTSDPAAVARAISRDLYWLDVRRIAEAAVRESPATGRRRAGMHRAPITLALLHRHVAATGRLLGPEERGEVLAHSHWRGSQDAQEAILHDIVNEIQRLDQPIVGEGGFQFPLPEHGARLVALRELSRDWFFVPAGATGTVTISTPGMIGMRLDVDLPGAVEDFDNTIVWLDSLLVEFMFDVQRIS